MISFSIRILFGLAFGSTVILASCSEEEPSLSHEMQALIGFNKIDEITKSQLEIYWNNDVANNLINNNVDVYKVIYESQNKFGVDIELSGAILIPDVENIKGIISLQHATFFANEEAPSENANFSVVSRKSIFASNGYIVFLPDYHGYGVDKDRIHPYHHASSLALSSYNMIIASKEVLTELGYDQNLKLFLAGYSEGAYATASLQQHIEKNTTFDVSGISLGSGAYNLKATFDSFLTTTSSGSFPCTPCNAFFVQSYDDIYQFDKSMSYYFQEPFASAIEAGLLLGDNDAAKIAELLTDEPDQLFNPQFFADYTSGLSNWNQALEENSIHEWMISVPALITHNVEDDVSPYFNSEELASLNSNNPNVLFEPIRNTNHFDGIFVWGIMTLEYFNQL